MAKHHRGDTQKPDDRSLPASRDKQGRPKPAQPNSDEQSGSAGRRTDTHEDGRTKDTGQDRYGQSGFGGKEGRETMGQSQYRRSNPGGQEAPRESNSGSGRPDVDSPVDHDPTKPPLKKRQAAHDP